MAQKRKLTSETGNPSTLLDMRKNAMGTSCESGAGAADHSR